MAPAALAPSTTAASRSASATTKARNLSVSPGTVIRMSTLIALSFPRLPVSERKLVHYRRERRRVHVALGDEQRHVLRPVDPDVGVAVAKSALDGRVVVRRALVRHIGDVGQHAEAVREADGDVELRVALVVEHEALPLAERRRGAAQIDDD